MKKFFVFVLITIAVFAAAVQAQERQLFKVDVPFSFTAENTSFPAGSYIVYVLNPYNVVRVQSPDGRHVAVVRGFPSQKHPSGKESALVFDRIDGQYFLAAVREHDAGIQRELPLGSEARELLAKERNPHGYPSTVSVSAR